MYQNKDSQNNPVNSVHTQSGIAEALKTAFQYHQSGNLNPAEEIYRKILAADPEHADALHLLGVVLYQKEDYEAAVEKISEAVRINPRNTIYYSNLGSAYKCLGKNGAAADSYRKALEIRPDYADAWYNLAVTLKSLGRPEESADCYQKAIALKPDYCEAYSNLGSVRKDQGKVDEALACFQKALEINPAYVQAYNNMGNAFKERGELAQAVAAYRKAVEIKPDYVKALNNLGNALNDLGQLEESLACFRKVKETEPDSRWSAAGEAKVFMRKGDFKAAYDALSPLAESGTDNVDVLISFAQIAPRFGKTEKALGLLESRLEKGVGDTDSLRQIYFSLGYLHDKTGDYDAAFAHYQKANNLRPRRFDALQHEKYIKGLIHAYPPDAVMEKSDNNSQVPVFILGMPRSGTTLAEQILSAHPQVCGAGELPYISNIAASLVRLLKDAQPYPGCLPVMSRHILNTLSAQYMKEVRKYSADALRISDKMPQNFLHIGLISQLFPKAKIIHCIRDPRDTGLSVYFQNFLGSHAYAFHLEDIGIYYREYERLMAHWKSLPYISFFNLSYEEMVENQEEMSRKLIAYIGLDWDEKCLEFYKSERSVITSSFQQVREPVYKSSAGRWRNYEKYLKDFAYALPPSAADTGELLKKAVAFHQQGDMEKARKLYNEILVHAPNNSDALHLLGLIAHQQGRNESGEEMIRRAVEINPHNPVYHFNLAIIQKKQGNPDGAVESYRKVTQMQPDHAEAWFNLANTLAQQKKTAEAVSCFQKNLELSPGSAKTWFNLGKAFRELGRYNESVDCYKKVTEIEPEHAAAYFNMGNSLKESGQQEEAVCSYRRAIELKPDYGEAYCNLGLALQEQKKYDVAVNAYRKAVALKPENITACSSLVFLLKYMCEWEEMERLSAGLDSGVRESLEKKIRPDEAPFMNIVRVDDSAYNYRLARTWAQEISRTVAKYHLRFSFDSRRRDKEKLTVGYLSNDYRNHPVAHLIAGLFAMHNRERFRIICYSYGEDDGSDYRNRIKSECDDFIDLRDMNTAESAKLIYDNQTDILLDLMGYTTDARMEICAVRPAPVQVSFLGYPGTSGADYFDYIITDSVISPEEHARFFSEKFVYMPDTYQINDIRQKISDKKYSPSDFGLPENDFVFCSFNQVYKIEAVMFDVWMNILKKVPESVLWLLSGGAVSEKRLKDEAEKRGVSPARMIFAGRMPKAEHLKRTQLAHLFLDTRIVNGHTTTSDALWSGVPVLTLLGKHFASRVSASLLKAAGLSELITHSLEEYENLAVRLARNPGELGRIRKKLWENRLTMPLFDTRRYAENLERAYEKMWERFAKGEEPQLIHVREQGG